MNISLANVCLIQEFIQVPGPEIELGTLHLVLSTQLLHITE